MLVSHDSRESVSCEYMFYPYDFKNARRLACFLSLRFWFISATSFLEGLLLRRSSLRLRPSCELAAESTSKNAFIWRLALLAGSWRSADCSLVWNLPVWALN